MYSATLKIKINHKIKTIILAGALSLPLALPLPVSAQNGEYDPYADAVSGSAALVTNADDAVGAPNGTTANMAGIGAALTLNMGEGEEGTQALRLHLGQINAQANITVSFLDENHATIATDSRQLGIDLDASTQNFAYNWTTYGKAYRFVRVATNLGGGVNLDAVEALGYIGSTPSQDTDGDGVPDRQDSTPLVPNAPPATTPSPAKPPRTSKPGGSSTSASQQVNSPPAENNDKDGDGMADDWELAHGLDPTDKADRSKDPDNDALSNLVEFRINSDPQKYDTDGDGMPDGWEYEHGLDVNTNDADGDPDGDYFTNLGEYRHSTDPNKADDLRKLFGKNCNEWAWLLGGVLLGLLAGALLAKRNAGKTAAKTTKSKRRK